MALSEYMRDIRRKVGSRLLEVPAVSVVARDHRGRILLVRHADLGSWMTPGGAIEPAETPANAAVREVWEETGQEIELTRLAGVYGGPEFVVRYENGDQTSYAVIAFEGKIVGGEMEADDTEILESRLFAPSELNRLDMPSWMREIIHGVLEGGEEPRFRPPTWTPPPSA